jgi:two-component system NarL family sensor kinase
VAAIRLDAKGTISEATPSAAAMLGFEPKDLRGRSLKDLALDGWQAAAEVAAARVRFGATESFELALKGRSGRRTLVEMTARAEEGAGAVISWSERRVRRAGRASESSADLQRIAYGLLHTQEAERMRVALELHDELSPIVVIAKYLIEEAIGRLGPEAPADSVRMLNDAAQRLRDVIAELGRISTELRPSLLDDLGLLPTLEWLCRREESSGRGLRIECRLSVSENDVPERLKLDVFRIVQDAVRNVVEHARATRAVVSLWLAGGEFCVVVEDDGTGFDLDAASSRRDGGINLGLQSIRKRVEATGGRFLFESQQQRGTRIGGAWRLEESSAPAA